MDSIIVWMVLVWGNPMLLTPGSNKNEVIALEDSFYDTEAECWSAAKNLVALGEMKVVCSKTMTSSSSLAKMTARRDELQRTFERAMRDQKPKP